jgi:hypothetical protein
MDIMMIRKMGIDNRLAKVSGIFAGGWPCPRKSCGSSSFSPSYSLLGSTAVKWHT